MRVTSNNSKREKERGSGPGISSGFRAARWARLALIVGLLSCAIAGFLVGRATGAKDFKLIGTPVEIVDGKASSPGGTPGAAGDEVRASIGTDQPARVSGYLHGICGAPTKSRKPCMRKVRGGGYCWQHRLPTVSNIQD